MCPAKILLIPSQNWHVRIIDFISKSACAQHHFPVILMRFPMEGFGRYLATQFILFTLVLGVSMLVVVLVVVVLVVVLPYAALKSIPGAY